MTQHLSIADGDPPADRDEGSISFLGAATVILRYGGFTVLVDPSFLDHGDHVHVGCGPASICSTETALGSEPLPPIDFVLLSSLHAEPSVHAVEPELDRHVPIVTMPRTAKTLRQRGFAAARGTATWDTVRVAHAGAAVRVTAMPVQHAPVPDGSFLPDAMDARLEFGGDGEPVGLRLHVSGDTVAHERLGELLRRDPGLDVALLKVGGTRVLGVLLADEAERGTALRLVGPREAELIAGGSSTPSVEELARGLRQRGLEAHVHLVARGERHVFRPAPLPPLPRISPGASAAGASEPGASDRAAAG